MTDTDYARVAHEAGLERVGARPELGEYMKEMWRRRAFATYLARYRIQATLGENRLGLGWIVLRPILNAVLFGTIFGLILPSDSRPDNFVPFLCVGIFIFEFFSKCFSEGARLITGNAALVRSLPFPRMLLPVSLIIKQVFELIPMMIVLGIIVLLWGEPLTWSWLMVIPILTLMTMFNLGIAMITARMTVHLRDVTQMVPLISRVMFYSSGIFYSLELVLKDKPAILFAAQLNPVHDYLALVRLMMIDAPDVPPIVWTVAVCAAFVTLAFGILFFWKAEERYGRE